MIRGDKMARMIPIKVKPRSFEELVSKLRPSIELSSYGNDLIYFGFSGRWFRTDIDILKDQLEEFEQLYADLCEKAEDGVSCDTLNLNDLYSMVGISSTTFGFKYGWTTIKDYAVCLKFRTFTTTKEENFEGMGENVFVVEFDEGCCPFDYYMEV